MFDQLVCSHHAPLVPPGIGNKHIIVLQTQIHTESELLNSGDLCIIKNLRKRGLLFQTNRTDTKYQVIS